MAKDKRLKEDELKNSLKASAVDLKRKNITPLSKIDPMFNLAFANFKLHELNPEEESALEQARKYCIELLALAKQLQLSQEQHAEYISLLALICAKEGNCQEAAKNIKLAAIGLNYESDDFTSNNLREALEIIEIVNIDPDPEIIKISTLLRPKADISEKVSALASGLARVDLRVTNQDVIITEIKTDVAELKTSVRELELKLSKINIELLSSVLDKERYFQEIEKEVSSIKNDTDQYRYSLYKAIIWKLNSVYMALLVISSQMVDSSA